MGLYQSSYTHLAHVSRIHVTWNILTKNDQLGEPLVTLKLAQEI